eukprot:SAG22_NODE_7583_length_726_cov_2.432217_1_plen_103_part_10
MSLINAGLKHRMCAHILYLGPVFRKRSAHDIYNMMLAKHKLKRLQKKSTGGSTCTSTDVIVLCDCTMNCAVVAAAAATAAAVVAAARWTAGRYAKCPYCPALF